MSKQTSKEKQKVSNKIPDSILKTEETEVLNYEEKDIEYISNLQQRLESAKLTREQPFKEFDGLTYAQYHETNESGANTYLKPSVNKVDTPYQSGTLRQKLISLIATYQGLNLKSDISAFSEGEVAINALGNSMEDIIDKVGELENDEEWKMLRQYEMLKQGTVYVEDIWDERFEVEKKVTKGEYGQKKKVEWTSKLVKTISRPRRSIISGLSVYLGDLTKYMIEDQPYVFTVNIISWKIGKKLFGDWENWQYVSKTKNKFSGDVNSAMENNAWRLTEDKEGQIEVIKYQDKPNNEFQIILNGIPMLPLGFPLTEVSPVGEYTLVQQNLEPIRHNFAYGKSFIFRNKNLVAVLDQMMKLAVLKTQKSFMPPYLNLSNRVISRGVFSPGKISRGVGKGELIPLNENETEGVTMSEYNMIQESIKAIDRNTTSQTFAGNKEQGGAVTATQIIELQRQARIMMGILILSASLLEKKLDTKRLMLLLERWFDPVSQVFDKARSALRNKYRIVSRQRTIEGKGTGVRMIVPMDNMPSKIKITQTQERLEKRYGKPVKILILNPKEIKKAKLTWILTVNAKEKRSSEYSKLLFDEMMGRAMNLGLNLSPDYVQTRFAEIWEEDPAKMFTDPSQAIMPPNAPDKQGAQGTRGGMNSSSTSPTPELTGMQGRPA